MEKVAQILRLASAVLIGIVGALVMFGLLLALVWAPASMNMEGYKAVSLLIVTAVAIVAGGCLSGLTVANRRSLVGLVLGLLLGFVSFGYVIGPGGWLLVAVVSCSVLGTIGGALAEKLTSERLQPG